MLHTMVALSGWDEHYTSCTAGKNVCSDAETQPKENLYYEIKEGFRLATGCQPVK